VELAWRGTDDVNEVLEHVVPQDPAGQLELLRLLSTEDREAEARAAWHYIAESKLPFDPALAYPYLQYLLLKNRGAEAANVWRDLQSASARLAEYQIAGNGITNPGFELPILNNGLDWRYTAAPGVSVQIDPDLEHSGARSLKLEFSGAVNETGIRQYLPVSTATNYRFSGYYRAQNLEGAGGVAWALVENCSGKVLTQTAALNATTDWQLFSVQFTTGTQCDLLTLQLVRFPAGDQLRGEIWFDDLSLSQQ